MKYTKGKGTEKDKIRPGRYLHFKGGEYVVIGIAHHSETLEDLVLYTHAESQEYWVRPVAMFTEEVEVDGTRVLRFRSLETKL